MKISTKVILVCSLLSLIFLSFIIFYVFFGTRNIFSDYILQSAEKEVEIVSSELDLVFDEIRSDVRYLSQIPPVQGMFRAQTGDGIDKVDGSTFEEWQNLLESIFVSFIESRDIYYQLRYINEEGKEIVGVDYKDGEIYRVGEENLQDKSNRF